jgi:hypothetical protein
MENKKKDAGLTPGFTITKVEAQARIQLWKDEQSAVKDALPAGSPIKNSNALHIKAFTFRKEDLVELMSRIEANNQTSGSPTINAVRFYLGEKIVSTNPNSIEPCLIAVGVEGFPASAPYTTGGKDITDLPNATHDPLMYNGIYDFSYPCPATCPETGYGISDS